MRIEHCTIIIEGSGRVPFYLRVTYERGITRRIDLDGASTLDQARRIAIEKGYDATHFMHSGDLYVVAFEQKES